MFYIFLAIAYLVGSIPFGLVITRLAGHGDIRAIGSGNIGATNVLRTGDKRLALATLALDSVKGASVIAAYVIVQPGATAFALLLVGLAALIGHCFPVWLKFKGGKGVATGLGVLLMAAPLAGLGVGLIWIVVVAVTRLSSLAAMSAAALCPLLVAYFYGIDAAYGALAIAFLVLARHQANITRLLAGQEPKIGQKQES
ncbi:MAG: glycerol-3-phosphate 1-O-acyltransferase PlsY [Alphaproteobacteria bacterium]|nr:glycerol-3-phosphate 1-O-acyltransferase PlsY [Alphaproteobacteria bacterium]